MSLSKEWALLSRAMYGQNFIEELSNFLKRQKVRTILECGCGDGNILQGLVNNGFNGLGIDGDSEMIQMANQEHSHPNINYQVLNWLDLGRLSEQYDCVMCRGNSLSYVLNWGKDKREPAEIVTKSVAKSIGLMFDRLRINGLLYVDTVRQKDIDAGNRKIELKYPNILLKGKIEYDLARRIRRTYGEGVVLGKEFKGGGESVFITPNELEGMILGLKPARVWHPNLKSEVNYHIVCAKK